MRFILIGNYRPDNQESMERFAQMLASGLEKEKVRSTIWRPNVIFGLLAKSTNSGFGKWLGYIDKWIVFPLILKWRSLNTNNKNIRYHICDHSNAPYLKYLPANLTAITCHDVLAIRGALGFDDAYCPASGMGKILQKWILSNLSNAKSIACVSRYTLNQLEELAPKKAEKPRNWRVIHNAFNNDFAPLIKEDKNTLLSKATINPGIPYILHVGSSLQRKNRQLLPSMVSSLGTNWQGSICFAGEALDDALLEQVDQLGLKHRVISVVKPSHSTLNALYNGCDAFIFPSFSEGFGWPVIEAQACGAPVIASNLEPMPEVSGGAALFADPNRPENFADAFLRLQDQNVRSTIVEQGFKNSSRFKSDFMISEYLKLHEVQQ